MYTVFILCDISNLSHKEREERLTMFMEEYYKGFLKVWGEGIIGKEMPCSMTSNKSVGLFWDGLDRDMSITISNTALQIGATSKLQVVVKVLQDE